MNRGGKARNKGRPYSIDRTYCQTGIHTSFDGTVSPSPIYNEKNKRDYTMRCSYIREQLNKSAQNNTIDNRAVAAPYYTRDHNKSLSYRPAALKSWKPK